MYIVHYVFLPALSLSVSLFISLVFVLFCWLCLLLYILLGYLYILWLIKIAQEDEWAR